MAHRSCREIQLCFPAAGDPGTAIADRVAGVHALAPLSLQPVPTMTTTSFSVPLPASWPKHAKAATLHVISLAHFALTHVRGWAVNSPVHRVRLAAERDRLDSEAPSCARRSVSRTPARVGAASDGDRA